MKWMILVVFASTLTIPTAYDANALGFNGKKLARCQSNCYKSYNRAVRLCNKKRDNQQRTGCIGQAIGGRNQCLNICNSQNYFNK